MTTHTATCYICGWTEEESSTQGAMLASVVHVCPLLVVDAQLRDSTVELDRMYRELDRIAP